MRYSHLLILLFALGAGKAVLAANDGHGHEESEHDHGETGHKETEDSHEEGEHDHGAAGHKETEGGHEEGGHGDHEEEGVVELTAQQIEAAGIETLLVEQGEISGVVSAPGEVNLNAYQTTKVAPRIAAQIVKRHVQLGESVVPGQVLVTLSSVEVAKAQGVLLVSDREWQRVKKLGRKVVSERRYIEAQVARQQAEAILRAFGMSDVQVKALLQNNSSSSASGELELLSPQHGTVIHDDFIVGELAEPGRELFVITNEDNLWIDARLTPEDAANVNIGAKARIKAKGQWVDAKVIQQQHVLDETTRTLSVRLQVANNNDALHPGEFVAVEIESSASHAGIAVPIAAVMRSPDGDWQVFLEETPGRFEPKEIDVQRTVGDRMVIQGLKAGERIVSKGAFFIQSEIAKGGFDIHNH